MSEEKKMDKHRLNFVRLWYSEGVNSIEDFINQAHEHADIKFTRKGDGSGSDEDKRNVSKDATKLRQDIARFVFGSGDRSKKEAVDDFKFGTPFVRWEARDRAGKDYRWHVRKLDKANPLTTNTSTTRDDKAAFDELFGSDVKVHWG